MRGLAKWAGLAALCLLVACEKDDGESMAGGDTDAGLPGAGGGAGGGGGGAGGEATVVDPAPGLDEPGAYGCEGCPTSEADQFELNAGSATTWEFSGVVQGAVGNGTFFVRGPGGRALGGTIPTDPESGSFSFEAPLFCGEQLVKCVWSNEAGAYTLVVRVVTDNCVEPDIRVTLTWDDLGADFELHLVKPGGRINDNATDCTWTSCIGTGPDWGVPGDPSDDPRKDVDNTGRYGPENIFLAGPEPGVYTVLVEHWGNGDPGADGQVTFNVAGRVVTAEIVDLAPRHVRTVGTIEWPSGEVRLVDDVYDCSDEWASGCTAALP